MKVYHVTAKCNLKSILAEGIHPKHSFGRRRAVYFVDHNRLSWAIAHVAGRHGWRISQVVILPVELGQDELKATPVPGIFYSEAPIPFVGPAQNALVYLARLDEAIGG